MQAFSQFLGQPLEFPAPLPYNVVLYTGIAQLLELEPPVAGRKVTPQMNWFICLACGVAERDQPCQAKDAHNTPS